MQSRPFISRGIGVEYSEMLFFPENSAGASQGFKQKRPLFGTLSPNVKADTSKYQYLLEGYLRQFLLESYKEPRIIKLVDIWAPTFAILVGNTSVHVWRVA